MIDVLHREFTYIWFYFTVQLSQIAGYWAIGILIGSVVSVFLKNRIHSALTELNSDRFGILGIIPASILGIISPLCLYGTVPIVASFSRSGMRQDWIAAFMMSSILLNPQLFLFSFALGTDMAFLRLFVSVFGGCIAGLLVRIFYRKKSFYKFDDFALPTNRDTDPNIAVRLAKNIWRNVKVTLPYFLIGVLLTALYQRYIPSEWIETLFRSDQGFGTLMAAALGVPLYTCGGGTIPIISSWLASGMSKGSAVSFMIAGPATKISNLGALKIVLGAKNFILYLIFIILYATISGIIVNLIFH